MTALHTRFTLIGLALLLFSAPAMADNAATPPDPGVLAGNAGRGDAKALADLQALAEKGNATAQFQLGGLYDAGSGVKRDEAATVKWWSKAAAQGDPAIQFNLGMLLLNGAGLDPDYAQAATWFHKAAAQDAPGAQFQLALLYAHGNGVKKDGTEAAFWLLLAAHHGVTVSQVLKDDIVGSLTPAQKAAAEDRVKKWKSAKPKA